MKKTTVELQPEEVSDIIQMALSDHVSFGNIEKLYGLKESQVVRLMRSNFCLLYTSPSPRDRQKSRMPSSA